MKISLLKKIEIVEKLYKGMFRKLFLTERLVFRTVWSKMIEMLLCKEFSFYSSTQIIQLLLLLTCHQLNEKFLLEIAWHDMLLKRS